MGVGGGEGDVERRGEMERDDDDHREKRQEKEMCQWEAGLQTTCQRIGQTASTVLQQPLYAAPVTALECLCICMFSVLCKRESDTERE